MIAARSIGTAAAGCAAAQWHRCAGQDIEAIDGEKNRRTSGAGPNIGWKLLLPRSTTSVPLSSVASQVTEATLAPGSDTVKSLLQLDPHRCHRHSIATQQRFVI